MGIKMTFKSNQPEVMRAIQGAARERIDRVVNEVRNVTLDTLSGNRTGEIYKVPGTQKDYTASAPGEPPASATGGLRQSIKTEVEEKRKSFIGRVGTELLHGRLLEFGTRRYQPRPWLRISFEKATPKIKDIFGGTWFR